MKTAAVAASFFLLTAVLAIWAWASARTLRLPGPARFILGLTMAPLVLPVITLALTLAWPGAPAGAILTAPGILALGAVFWRRAEYFRACTALRTRVGRIKKRHLVGMLAGLVLLVAVIRMLVTNASEPVSAHDALIYLNEARLFADNPRWETWFGMTEPDAPDGVVRGHTHTWYYTSFLAVFQLARGEFGGEPMWDWPARAFGQLNVLHLVLAVGALTWAMTRGRMELSLAAMATVACLPHFEYISTSNSIDAFRILPLVLAVLVLTPCRLSHAGWALAAALVIAAAAAHTLNVIFAPLLLVARVAVGMPAGQWKRFLCGALPALLGGGLLVAAYYGHVWYETGRFFGHGMNYYFHVGPLAQSKSANYLDQPAPPLMDALREVAQSHASLAVWLPLAAGGLALCARSFPALRFLALAFIISVALALSGQFLSPLRTLTLMMLQNFRYPLGVLVLGPPLIAGAVAWLARRARWRAGCANPRLAHAAAAGLGMVAAFGGAWNVSHRWQRTFDVYRYLREGELEIARLVAWHVGCGQNWLTDRPTVAYYANRPPQFLYTPAGSRWILLPTKDAALRALLDEHVRVVALYNADPDWWPRTPLYQALCLPGVAHRLRLPRWEVFLVKIATPAESAPTRRDAGG